MPTIYLENLNISPHKQRILKLRIEGQSNQDIADKFGLSIKTVEAHLQSIYDRYDARGLVNLAFKLGWLRVYLRASDLPESKQNIGLTLPNA